MFVEDGGANIFYSQIYDTGSYQPRRQIQRRTKWPVKATYLSNSLGRLRGREMVHWLWQTEEFIAGSAIHS